MPQPRHANSRVSGAGAQWCVTWWPKIALQILLPFAFIQLMKISTTTNISERDTGLSGWCYFISSSHNLTRSVWLLFYCRSENRTLCPKPHSSKWQVETQTQAGNCGSSQRQTALYQSRSILTPLPGTWVLFISEQEALLTPTECALGGVQEMPVWGITHRIFYPGREYCHRQCRQLQPSLTDNV